jgi:hypothetical protein
MGAYELGEMVIKLDDRNRIIADAVKKEKESSNLKIFNPFL